MDWKDIEKAVREQGGTVVRTKKNEPLYTLANGYRVLGSGTPGDQRSIKNTLSQLERGGLIWPWGARQRRAMRKEKRNR